jgi:hypothetical protein
MNDAELIEAFVAEFTKREPLRLVAQFSLPHGIEPDDVAPLLTEPWRDEADEDVLNRRSADGDCAIVKADHEEILIHERFHVIGVLAGSFRELIRQTITRNRPN